MLRGMMMEDAARLEGLISSIAEDTFYTELLAVVCDLLECDSAAVIGYQRDRIPGLVEEALKPGERESFDKNYSAGVYLVSPFYTAWRDGEKVPLTRFEDLAPDEFGQSINYGSHTGRAGKGRDVGFLIRLKEDRAFLVYASRVEEDRPISDERIAGFRALEPMIRATILRHYELTDKDGLATADRLPIVQQHVAEAFDRFGASLLTRREREIVRLILEGHSSKSAARILNISPRTESVHRKNIYNKLKVSSQSELFALFFQALTHESSAGSKDPVAALVD